MKRIGGGLAYSGVDKKRAYEDHKLFAEKMKQPGISFPSPSSQAYILIVRIDLKSTSKGNVPLVRKGLWELCGLFERISEGRKKINVRKEEGEERSSLTEFNFSSTVGFGIGFFEKLGISHKKRPRRLYQMPDHAELGDLVPYVFTQTDMIVQICSADDYVNRWVLKTDSYPMTSAEEKKRYDRTAKIDREHIHDISTALEEWAYVTDVHSGFQRLDGRNLLGFLDGISQPNRLVNDVTWTTAANENNSLANGSYMVFQKIEHDLQLWETLSVVEQEQWIGRSKGTGLLLGTLPRWEDEKLANDCMSDDPRISRFAKSKLKKLLEEQRDPHKAYFNSSDPKYKNIQVECPVWSHARKANPRGADGAKNAIIFRRGYLFMEDTLQPGRRPSSGLLFICFQKDIRSGFEYIKKRFLNNKNFPVPELRENFNRVELASRKVHGKFTNEEIRRLWPYLKPIFDPKLHAEDLTQNYDPDLQNTGKDGLSGPSQLGVYPRGNIVITTTLGGGYYFVPPIPRRRISEIGQQFFD